MKDLSTTPRCLPGPSSSIRSDAATIIAELERRGLRVDLGAGMQDLVASVRLYRGLFSNSQMRSLATS